MKQTLLEGSIPKLLYNGSLEAFHYYIRFLAKLQRANSEPNRVLSNFSHLYKKGKRQILIFQPRLVCLKLMVVCIHSYMDMCDANWCTTIHRSNLLYIINIINI